jgi:hypothetical protein
MASLLLVRRLATSVCVLALSVCIVAGCNPEPAPKAAEQAGHDDHDDHEHGHHHHHHAEKGPHGGTLVAVGEDAAHLEIVLDAQTGTLTAYILDAQAKQPVSLQQDTIDLGFSVQKEGAKKDDLPELRDVILKRSAESNAEYTGQSDDLKGLKEFGAAIGSITIGDKEFKNVEFRFPEGNEHDHHHH